MVGPLTQILLYLVIALGVYFYWKRNRTWASRLKDCTPTGVFSLPIIGHMYQIFGTSTGGYLARFLEIGASCGVLRTRKPAMMWMGEIPCTAIFAPEDIEVLLGSSKEITKPDFVYKPVRNVFGDGLITLNDNTWQHHRKVLTPTFHFKILERYAEVFRKYAQEFVEELRDPKLRGVEVDAMPLTARVVSQTICETAFGMSERLSQTDEMKKKEEFFDALDVSFRTVRSRVLKPWLTLDLLFRLTPEYHEQQKAEKIIKDYALRVIRMKKREVALEEPGQVPSGEDDIGAKKKVAFLDLVLRDAKNILSEDEILQEVRTLVTVQQTTASTLAFIFVMLATHPDIQEKVYGEVCDILDNSQSTSYYEKLGEMKYLERVIKETIRLYPVTAVFSRKLKEDMILPNGKIPRGVICFVIPFVTHRDQNIYGPDAERFDPDHFLPERCRTRHPYAYIPFSAGPRNCIGQKYAMLQMKAIVSTVVRNIHILPSKTCQTQEDVLLDVDTFLHIVGGFNVRFEPRNVITT